MTVAMAALVMVSCEDLNDPTMEFEHMLYTVYAGGSVDITVKISEPAASDVTVSLVFSGDAEKGVDYTVSEESLTFLAGSKAASFTLKNISLTPKKQVGVGFLLPEGYIYGENVAAIITADSDEALVYSFSSTKGTALEGFYTEISVKGEASGANVVTTKDITIPLKTLDYLILSGGSVVLPAGQTKVGVSFTLPSNFEGDATDVVAVDDLQDKRFSPGGNASVKVDLKGLQTPDKLLGTWTFSRIIGQEDIEQQYQEAGDDTALLPIHNNGFTLTFSRDASGDVMLTPGSTGDFANFFRTASVTLASPKNMTSSAVKMGSYSVRDHNSFAAKGFSTYQYNTYYRLSSANRAFSAETEKLGEATIIFSLVDEGLYVEFRDYDTPPFGEKRWNGSKFDPEMFGFASLFTK